MEFSPMVSILMPTYNYGHHIGEAIESALNQTYADFELIIVDDVSSDNTDEVVTRYLADKRVSYYKNPINLGLVGNFNKCLTYGKGKYIKFLLADDKFEPTLLEKFVSVMEQYPNVSLVTSYRDIIGSAKKKRPPLSGLQDGKRVIFESLKEGNGNWIGEPTTVMFRKSDLSVGNFDPSYYCLVDWEMWLRLLSVGDCYIIPESLSYFRVHPGQASQKIRNDYKFTFEDYYFYKEIETKNKYQVDLKSLGIEYIIKKRAAYCSKAMYKVLPKIFKKKERSILAKAFRIALREKVLLTPLYNTFHERR
jgi:glycosyltransferase involved in cell wall biosynthesis